MCIDVEPNTTIIDHLKTAFTKIEEMYKYHPDVLGPSVEAFCPVAAIQVVQVVPTTLGGPPARTR